MVTIKDVASKIQSRVVDVYKINARRALVGIVKRGVIVGAVQMGVWVKVGLGV